jgi:uncharacterized protein
MLEAIDASVAVFVRGLTQLDGMLAKAQAHGAKAGAPPEALLRAKLAGDMYDLATQVHWAGEAAKLAVDRVLGADATPLPDDARTFDALRARLAAAIAHLAGVDAAALDAGLTRTIEVRHRGGAKTFSGARFLTEFAIPSFYFHLAMAYAILRHEGVPLQKGDFLGS